MSFFVTLTLPFSCDRRSVLRVGFWLGLCGRSHIFHSSVSEGWDDRVEHCANVVGKYCIFKHGGCTGVALQVIACERHVWVSFGCQVHVVMAELVLPRCRPTTW
jgi:hypothetical protein